MAMEKKRLRYGGNVKDQKEKRAASAELAAEHNEKQKYE
jgi:hypothetical protein